MWATSEYPVWLRDDQLAMQRRHTARGGGQPNILAEIGDLVGMYNFVTHERMHDSLLNNIERVKNSTTTTRCYPMRSLARVTVGRKKRPQIMCPRARIQSRGMGPICKLPQRLARSCALSIVAAMITMQR